MVKKHMSKRHDEESRMREEVRWEREGISDSHCGRNACYYQLLPRGMKDNSMLCSTTRDGP